ncbi:MAG: TspO/MBR family protein [Candidatus Aminicenantaceae bacterium]
MKLKSIGGAVLAVVVCQAAGILGAVFTAPAIPTWYASLQKPAFTPPSWLFAPAWITLYTLMGIAVYLVLRQGWEKPAVRSAVYVFGLQLVLNALWTPLFFGLHWLLVAFFEITLLWILIFLTIQRFWKISRPAGLLMIPYLLWVSFASALNLGFLILNR